MTHSSQGVARALNLEAEGHYEQAQAAYRQLMEEEEEGEDGEDGGSRKRHLEDAYLRSLQAISNWEDMASYIGPVQVTSLCQDPWKRQFVLPHFFKSNFHLLVEANGGGGSGNNLSSLDEARRDRMTANVLESRFELELALLYVHSNKLKDAKYWSDKKIERLVRDWNSGNGFATGAMVRTLAEI